MAGETEGQIMTETLRNMNDQELFCVLTGSRGIMAQTYLRELILDYRALHGGRTTGLKTMVRSVLAGQERNAG